MPNASGEDHPQHTRAARPADDILRAPDAFVRTIVDTMPECIKIVSPDGRLLFMNAAGLDLVGATSWAGVANTRVLDLVAPECRDEWCRQHERVCAGERLSWEFDIVGADGMRKRIETHAGPISLSDGTLGQLAVSRDVTARRDAALAIQRLNETLAEKVGERTRELERALAQLGESERSFALLVDSVTDYALFRLDTSGRIASWNAGAQRIKGYSAAEVIGRHFSLFYTAEDCAAKIPERGLATAARDGRFETEGWRVRKDGSRFWANVIIDAIRDRGELVGFAKITRDITERRATEERLRHAQKMEAVGQFTGGAAHDFNNLLTAIIGSLELLRKRLPDDTGMRALLDNAMQGARRGAQLTRRMLAFARRQELKHEAVDLHALVGGLESFLGHAIGPAIEVRAHVPRGLPRVRTDANQLESALQNLAFNARDAMPDGGTIAIEANEERVEGDHPASLAPGHYVRIAVSDTGHGMDEATLARATEPFFTTKGVGKGTGLGLSMVDGLAAQSGGRLAVRSEEGRGTTVELWLPVAIEETRSIRDTPLPPSPATRAAPQPLVILAVDDDDLVLINVTAMLEDLGHTVVGARSAAQAIEIIESGAHVDLVVSDQAMPGMTGVQLLAAIHERRPGLPAILATGFAELPPATDPTIRRLAKPFSQRDLAEAVEAARR